MKKTLIFLGIATILITGIGSKGYNIYVGSYNKIVTTRQDVDQAIGDLEAEYQKRYSLINNFLALVKETKSWESYLIDVERKVYLEIVDIEKEIFTKTAEAKAQATKMSIQAPDVTNKRIKKEDGLGNILTNAMDKLMVMSQRFPEIKDPPSLERPLKDRIEFYNSIRILHNKIERIEMEIQHARKTLNAHVAHYNKNISIFPANLIAARHGFSKVKFYSVTKEEAREDVQVSF